MLEPTRATPGCLDARLFTDLYERETVLLVEEWESRAHLEFSFDSHKLKMIVGAIESADVEPVVRIDVVEREEGVAALAGLQSSRRTLAGNLKS